MNKRPIIRSSVETDIFGPYTTLEERWDTFRIRLLVESSDEQLFRCLPEAEQREVLNATGLDQWETRSLSELMDWHDALLTHHGVGTAVVDHTALMGPRSHHTFFRCLHAFDHPPQSGPGASSHAGDFHEGDYPHRTIGDGRPAA